MNALGNRPVTSWRLRAVYIRPCQRDIGLGSIAWVPIERFPAIMHTEWLGAINLFVKRLRNTRRGVYTLDACTNDRVEVRREVR